MIARPLSDGREVAVFESLTLPAEHFVLMRAVMLLVGVLGQLQATGTWLDVALEWLLGQAPVTELGVQEAEFFGGRFDASRNCRHDGRSRAR